MFILPQFPAPGNREFSGRIPCFLNIGRERSKRPALRAVHQWTASWKPSDHPKGIAPPGKQRQEPDPKCLRGNVPTSEHTAGTKQETLSERTAAENAWRNERHSQLNGIKALSLNQSDLHKQSHTRVCSSCVALFRIGNVPGFSSFPYGRSA